MHHETCHIPRGAKLIRGPRPAASELVSWERVKLSPLLPDDVPPCQLLLVELRLLRTDVMIPLLLSGHAA